jgi:hypothetical protein
VGTSRSPLALQRYLVAEGTRPGDAAREKGEVGGGGCKESDARSLRGGGGELGKLKTLTYGFTIFA